MGWWLGKVEKELGSWNLEDDSVESWYSTWQERNFLIFEDKTILSRIQILFFQNLV